MDKYKFGEFIYRKRKSLGMTQEDLGRKLNVTNKAVSKWETGETQPDLDTIISLASILNVTTDELLTQVPPVKEKEIIYKTKKYPFIILYTLIAVLLIFSIITVIVRNSNKNKIEKIQLNANNINQYYSISLDDDFYLNNQSLSITGSIKSLRNFSSIENIKIDLLLNADIYYTKTDNNIGVISFYDTPISITVDKDYNSFNYTFEAKKEIENFKCINRFSLNYKFDGVKGDLIL